VAEARNPLITIAVDIMNDRGKRIFLRSLPFAAIVAILVILQPQYVGFEKVWGFAFVALCAVAGLLLVLVLPRAIIVVMRASQEKVPLSEFLQGRVYEEMRKEWRET
jgi:hypothetical protein